MRTVIYDTETTGKEYNKGHRIVEIAMVELEDGVETGRYFHTLINPERDIPDEVVAVHGITNAKVANAPRFREVMGEIVDFIRGAILVAHNSEFDEKFINMELELAKCEESFWSIVSDTKDTLDMSRRLWVGKDPITQKNYKHKLDDILDRCGIDRSERVLHGALIDTQLLVKAFLSMEQKIKEQGPTLEDDIERSPIVRVAVTRELPIIQISEDQMQAHNAYFAPKSNSFKP